MRDMVGKEAYEAYKNSHTAIRMDLDKELDEAYDLDKIKSDYYLDIKAADTALGGSYFNESSYKKDLTDKVNSN